MNLYYKVYQHVFQSLNMQHNLSPQTHNLCMERIRFHHRSAIHSGPAQAVLNRPCHLLLKRLRSKQPQYLNAEKKEP